MLPLCREVLWIRSHIRNLLPANGIYKTPSRKMVKFMPGASLPAYSSVVGRENSLQRGARFSVSTPWLLPLHKERLEFV